MSCWGCAAWQGGGGRPTSLQQLLTGLRVRQRGALVPATDVLEHSIVGTGLVEVVEAAEALDHVPRVVRQQLVEVVELVRLAVLANCHRAAGRLCAQLEAEHGLALLKVAEELSFARAHLLA